MNIRFKYLKVYALILLGIVGFVSCTETDTLPLEPRSANKILSYRIVNSGNESDKLYGAINNTNNTITLNLPFYFILNTITPEIKIEDGATILDADGDTIDFVNRLPDDIIIAESSGYKYKVIASDGAVREYTLIINTLPAESFIAGYFYDNVTFMADNTSSRWIAVSELYSYYFGIFGNFNSLRGDAVLTMTNKRTQKVIQPPIIAPRLVTFGNSVLYYLKFELEAKSDTGRYDVKLNYLGHIAQLPEIKLIKDLPELLSPKSNSFTQGEKIVLGVKDKDMEYLDSIKIEYYNEWNVKVDFTYTNEEVSVSIPETIPAHFYKSGLVVRYYMGGGDFGNNNLDNDQYGFAIESPAKQKTSVKNLPLTNVTIKAKK